MITLMTELMLVDLYSNLLVVDGHGNFLVVDGHGKLLQQENRYFYKLWQSSFVVAKFLTIV
jgi:hypothetical protein